MMIKLPMYGNDQDAYDWYYVELPVYDWILDMPDPESDIE